MLLLLLSSMMRPQLMPQLATLHWQSNVSTDTLKAN
jgi:hypothetical protein